VRSRSRSAPGQVTLIVLRTVWVVLPPTALNVIVYLPRRLGALSVCLNVPVFDLSRYVLWLKVIVTGLERLVEARSRPIGVGGDDPEVVDRVQSHRRRRKRDLLRDRRETPRTHRRTRDPDHHNQPNTSQHDPRRPDRARARDLSTVRQRRKQPTNRTPTLAQHHTVRNHIKSILAKLQLENRIQAAVQAVRAGIS